MKASRAAIRTAKAVKAVEERLAAAEKRQAAMGETLERLTFTVTTNNIETANTLQQLVAAVEAVTAEKPTTAAEALGKPGAPKARARRKRGGGA